MTSISYAANGVSSSELEIKTSDTIVTQVSTRTKPMQTELGYYRVGSPKLSNKPSESSFQVVNYYGVIHAYVDVYSKM